MRKRFSVSVNQVNYYLKIIKLVDKSLFLWWLTKYTENVLYLSYGV